jgi:hypothetical protein
VAAVAVCIVAITFPLVLLQRWLLKTAGKYVSVKGKATRQKLLPLGAWKWLALAIVALWLVFTIVVPISGIALRAFVEQWGEGINLGDVLTLANFRQVFDQSDQVRAIVNTFLIGTIGGGLAVACYTAIGLAGHRQQGGIARSARLPGADPTRGAGIAGGAGLPLDLSVRSGPQGVAQHRVLGVACLHGGVAGLRIATDLQRAVADRAGARGGRSTAGASRAQVMRASDPCR